ncbi:inverted formin-2-like [Pyrus ussuriensis x Pyrus communis]|uniref:Inverted formin-2-like n=1 Tax=Pyrus ussuriensis x Pyrus communis TaxID=2448454 RepID=A0A5N5FMJ4_9ROSA|nr:inverted formin-2-like [Pyrus ussuriensis x Pyrus communis]KAB2620174.1 inverted formin-2-like [Pyrus ussuriensis x Pyrus communis]KAB2624140.1 inverted formin-2-like [Pyrus ussuriensis x Pyrus communis]
MSLWFQQVMLDEVEDPDDENEHHHHQEQDGNGSTSGVPIGFLNFFRSSPETTATASLCRF